MQGVAIVNGVEVPLAEAGISVLDPAFTVGWGVFEALTSVGGVPDNLSAHLDRLELSCAEACIVMPDRRQLEKEIHLAARRQGGQGRIRVTLSAGGTRVVTCAPLDMSRRGKPITAVRGVSREDPYLPGSVKHTSRASWMVAVARAGVDEVLLVDGRGLFVEGTTTGILAVIDGVIWTHPQDGRILESTTVRRLFERAEALAIPWNWQAPPAAGPWDALYVSSVSRYIAPVTLLDGERLSGWDPVGRRLAGMPVR